MVGTRPLRTLEFVREDREQSYVTVANRQLKLGWRGAGGPPVMLVSPIPWEETEEVHRSWRWRLHAWQALRPLLVAYVVSGELRFLRVVIDVIADWTQRFIDRGEPSEFAWYDAAVGTRAMVLGAALDAAARLDEVSDHDLECLLRCAERHLAVLSDDTQFTAHSNHGLFQALGQLALATKLEGAHPEAERHIEQAKARIRHLLDVHFSSEAIHLEHSPGYHLEVLEALDQVLSSGLLSDADLIELRRAIAETLAWFILPNGEFAMFGDTGRQPRPRREFDDVPALTWALTAGAVGEPPSGHERLFPDAGWWVVRSGDSYLAQTAGFHSRVHKHADDLSVIWFDHGQELLTDGGRYGYDYANPWRRYCESVAAHNTVSIDGAVHRFSARRREYPRPYGSALEDTAAAAGVHYSRSRMTVAAAAVLVRRVVFCPGQWLLLVDRVVDAAGRPHEATSHLLFAPALDLRQAGPGWLTLDLGDEGDTDAEPQPDQLHMVPIGGVERLEIARGETEPVPLGWTSPQTGEIEPTWSARLVSERAADVTTAALLALGPSRPRPGGIAVRERGLTVTWHDQHGRHQLAIDEPADRSAAVAYEVTPSRTAATTSESAARSESSP